MKINKNIIINTTTLILGTACTVGAAVVTAKVASIALTVFAAIALIILVVRTIKAIINYTKQKQNPLSKQTLSSLEIKTLNKELQMNCLNTLLEENDLNLIWENREKFPSTDKIESKQSVDTLYNYINGIMDMNGEVQDLAISGDQLEYVEKLRSIIDNDSPVKVSLQPPQGIEQRISPIKEELSRMMRPLDAYLENQESKLQFEQLSEEHKIYIHNSAQENYLGISPEEIKNITDKESELGNNLDITPLQQQVFRRCVGFASRQNAARSGFIHFRLHDAHKSTPFERIYIQMNKERAEDLVRLLIAELYKEGEYPGVLDIKVAGPQIAGRTDGIVIYIGEASQNAENEPLLRENAAKEREGVLKKLKEIQEKQPELFGNGTMPFKKIHVPGVASIPGLSTCESFTKDLSRAIVSALANATDQNDFRNKIIEAFCDAK